MGKKVNDEFKSLVVRDIAARLPYGITVRVTGEWFKPFDCDLSIQYNSELAKFEKGELDLKPYLRSMETMTEEEKEECVEMGIGYWDSGHYEDDEHSYLYGGKTFQLIPCSDTYDYCNRHYIDYRGMIDSGLALEAPKDMYKF